MILNYLIIFGSAILAAFGQIFLKIGASQKTHWLEFINWYSFSGCLCYGLGLLLWIYSLSKLPLSIAYLFTMVTFSLVYFLSWLFLNEPISKLTILGIFVIGIGIILTYLGQNVSH